MKAACKGAECSLEKEIRFDSQGDNEMITSEKDVADWVLKVATLCS